MEWTVVFSKAATPHWIQKYLDPYFQHCYAYREIDGEYLVINPLYCHISTELKNSVIIKSDDVVLSVKAKINTDQHRHTFCIINCVEVVKGLLGIRSFWTWTPFQLYKYLLEHNNG